jgi:signal transduction histidine kinase
MKLGGGPGSLNIKIMLFICALLIGLGTLVYTNNLVQELQNKERNTVQLYAKGLEYIANSTDMNDITFLFENLIRPIDFPMLLTGPDNSIGEINKSNIRNIVYDSTLSAVKLKAVFAIKVKEMDAIHKPIEVRYNVGQESIILTKIHYGDSELITKLRYYPYVQLLIAAVFLIIGYIAFSQIKRSEQSNIWVGMAKETAHQFGTPLSSLMGWLELLKINYRDPDKVQDIANEIEDDVEKLSKITNRFSKIGSKATLKEMVVGEVVKKVYDYFKRRIPQTGKNVELLIEGDLTAHAMMNAELFEWVLENLIKNALDAIDHTHGKIYMIVKEFPKRVEIEVADNGKGIDLKHRKDVFRPGYSTKRRGWGLGLSLSKRIVENYHKGKINVKSSASGEGTTFKIILNKH